MTELWRDVQGYEGLYEVSNLGEVRSLPRATTSGKTLTPNNSGKGYLQVALYKNGKSKRLLVHRLVAQAFVPNPLNLSSVNHKDENKKNNRFDNLEWCTPQYNLSYNGLHKRRGLPRYRAINQYTRCGAFVKRWRGAQDVEDQLGFSHSSIAAVCRGKRTSAYNYIWRYADE